MIATQQSAFFQKIFSEEYSFNQLLASGKNLDDFWKKFFSSYAHLGEAEIFDRRADIHRFLKENGVTYNIYGDPAGLNRPWNLDVIPYIIEQQEWLTIEKGLTQRAELFNLILKDIYGEQQLIKKGLLPVELIYNHPGFLRECAGISMPWKRHLVLYSADIARSPDGKIWVISDRSQAPSGSGYALENRTAMARILPELFADIKVQQLSPYFNELQTAFNEIAPAKQNPRIVILTPGPRNETYFEHSYLSSFLGYTLVQGDDLMVKDNCVWLKTIGGLEKVDVILRRVDDVYCDPLELKSDSQLGVAGLLQAVRSGNVSIANPLGSSILENPGLIPFLPAIAKHLLNEPLILPTIASWWCGQPKELNYVLNNIQHLIIKRIYRYSNSSSSIDGSKLSKNELNQLKETIKTHPYLYVGQEKVSFATSPSLNDKKIQPTNALFRSYLVGTNDGYTVMKGGLTRTTGDLSNILISNQLGGMSKDTWVISNDIEQDVHVRHHAIQVDTAPAYNDTLPSQTAENLFWVGRYAERILANARFQRTVMQFLTQGNQLQANDHILAEHNLLMALTHHTCTYPGFVGENSAAKLKFPSKELASILFDANRQGSLSFNLTLFLRAVNAVRDHWSTDTWRVLRTMEEDWQNIADNTPNSFKMITMLNHLITSMVAFIGLNRESISREQGWTILDTGRKIEQSLLLISMLRATLVNKQDDLVEYNLQEAVLKSNETLVNYRYKYRVHIQLSLVLDLMLLDENNPRSLAYQITRIKRYLSILPKKQKDNSLLEHERLILEAYTLLKLSDKDSLSMLDSNLTSYQQLDTFLSKMYALLSAIPNAISKTYFKHAQTQKQLFTAADDIV